ncbi:MAG TPA: HdeD family acid-resistance protein [Stellaceae bacterium]|nr:HdeD family acid-resistance protein [Stellaceae bacterium]
MSSIDPNGNAALAAALRKSLHEHWRLLLAEGIILVLLGIAAILLPPVAGLAITIFVGWLFLIGGVVGVVATLGARHAPGFGWSLLSAIVALLAGGVLLWNPLQGLLTLTYVLIAYFVVDGVLMIVFALEHRRELSGRWEWLMVNGVIDLVLAALVLAGLPGSSAWALGLLVGIDLVFGGSSLIAMALAARQPAV